VTGSETAAALELALSCYSEGKASAQLEIETLKAKIAADAYDAGIEDGLTLTKEDQRPKTWDEAREALGYPEARAKYPELYSAAMRR
jgi:hypothetical protein